MAASGALTLLLRSLTHAALATGVISGVGLRAAVLIVATVAEARWVFQSRPRPWAVNRQVPQSWGHTHGPWKAALRYGPRLSFGPATILTSWVWWGGVALAATAGGWAWLVFSSVFVVTRAVATVVLPGDPANGVELAQRMARVRSWDGSAGYVPLGALLWSVVVLTVG